MLTQLLWGTGILIICSLIHIILLLSWTLWLDPLLRMFSHVHRYMRMFILTSATLAIVVLSHALQVWIWALALYSHGALPDMADSVYFAVTSYTTAGFGDIILEKQFRIFGSIAAVSGMLAFGLSTAFLVGMLQHVLLPHTTIPDIATKYKKPQD